MLDEIIEVSVEEQIQKAVEDATKTFKSEIAGLNRKNTELSTVLERKKSEGQSVEERIATLEKERVAAVKRAETVEAYAKAGVSDEWRSVLSLNDPEEQANKIKEMISDVKATASEELAKEFNVDPAKHLDGTKRSFTAESLKGKSVDEINRLWNEGRVV